MGDQLRIYEDDGVAEWEAGLPSVDQLASLSVSLIPADLASAFRILPVPLRTAGDVNRASQSTLISLNDVKPVSDRVDDCCEVDEQEGSDPKKSRVMNPIDDVPPPSDNLFASSEATSNGGGPIHGNGNENRLHNSGESGNHEASNGRIPTQMPYPLPPYFTPVPIMAVAAESVDSGYHGIQLQHNNMMMMQLQRDLIINMYNSHPYHAVNQIQT